jgi:hypothetical protein
MDEWKDGHIPDDVLQNYITSLRSMNSSELAKVRQHLLDCDSCYAKCRSQRMIYLEAHH